MKPNVILTSLFIATLVSCSVSDDDNSISTKVMTVEVQPYTVMMNPGPFSGTPKIEHLVLIEEKTKEKHHTPSIKGFKYTKGNTYRLKVKLTIDKGIMDSGGEYELLKALN